jgi:hypothetical protein
MSASDIELLRGACAAFERGELAPAGYHGQSGK